MNSSFFFSNDLRYSWQEFQKLLFSFISQFFFSFTVGFVHRQLLLLDYNLVQAMRIAYLIVSSCWLASGLILLRLKETIQSETVKISVKQAIRQYPRAFKECVTVWKSLSKPMLNLLIVFTPIMFFIRMCVPYYVLYANQVLQIKEFQWALLQTWSSIVLYVALIPIGKLVDVYGRKKPLLLSSIAFILGLSFFLYGDMLRLYIFFALSAIVTPWFSQLTPHYKLT